jgi:phosphorylcholine metabolism protein LicD
MIKILLFFFIILLSSILIIFIRLKILKYLLINVTKVFNEEDIDYWIDFGTLLGIYRDNKIILYDNDIDICIINFDKDKINNCQEKLKKMYINLEDEKTWSAYRCYINIGIFNSYKFGFFGDIYINRINNTDYIGATGSNSNISKELIGTPKEYNWEGHILKVPENIEETLKWRYGDDYMTPKIFFKGRN